MKRAEIVNLTLPEWAFLDARSHEGEPLGNRTVINHVRSASIIEIFDRDIDKFALKEEVLTFKFKSVRTGERLMAALHYSASVNDEQMLKEILRKCAIWYCDYMDWEDENMALDGAATLN